MPQRTKLSFVRILLLRVLQENNETLRGTTLFQMKFEREYNHEHVAHFDLEYDKHILPNNHPPNHMIYSTHNSKRPLNLKHKEPTFSKGRSKRKCSHHFPL